MSERQNNSNKKQEIALPGFRESETERMARGSLTEEQLQQSSEMFADIFDNLMLEHMAAVRLVEDKRLIGTLDQAKLGGELIVDGQRYCLHLRDRNSQDIRRSESDLIKLRGSERIVRYLNLQIMDGNGGGRQYWSYRLGLDGVIRRYDIDTPKMNHLATTDKQNTVDLIDSITKDLPNQRLEEDTGINNQPVSPKELHGLAEFINQGSFSASND